MPRASLFGVLDRAAGMEVGHVGLPVAFPQGPSHSALRVPMLKRVVQVGGAREGSLYSKDELSEAAENSA